MAQHLVELRGIGPGARKRVEAGVVVVFGADQQRAPPWSGKSLLRCPVWIRRCPQQRVEGAQLVGSGVADELHRAVATGAHHGHE